jgi:NTE family protein
MTAQQTQPGRRQWLGTALGGVAALSSAVPLGVLAQASAPRRPTGRSPRLAVVLGGGSARGFAHIGVIKALEGFDIKPDAIFGCSAGALVGAFWAAGFSGSTMEALAYRVRDDDVIDLVTGNTASRRGIVSGVSLQRFVNSNLNNRSIEGMLTPFRAVATRYPSGELAVFRAGDTGFAVRASCSIPGVFIPAMSQGQEYLDGGLVSPMPVQAARDEGFDLVVAVDVGGPDPGEAKDASGGLYQLLLRSFDIMGQSLRRQEGLRADVLIRPDVSRISSTDFMARRALVDAGFAAAQRLAPVIQEKLKARR